MREEFVRNPYNYDSDMLSLETSLECKDESLTEQEHAEEADINYIADRFMRTGEIPQVLNLPTAGDFSGIFDFQSAMNTIVQAKQEFMNLPAKTRARFENDPAQLIAFVQDETNREEAIKLGFIPKPRDTTQGENSGPATGNETQAIPESEPRNRRARRDEKGNSAAQGPGPEAGKDD